MRIAFITAEVAPYSKTGGLADVAASLPVALRDAGHQVVVVAPLYRVTRSVVAALGRELETVVERLAVSGPLPTRPTRLCRDPLAAVPTYFIEQDDYFDRAGIYQSEGHGYGDSCARFAFFCRAAVAAVEAIGAVPDVYHCHDWHTALIPGLLRASGRDARSASMLTLHNLAYQGQFAPWEFAATGLPGDMFSMEGYEFYGALNFLKGGILLADKLTTVSPSYAHEILRPESGHGLDAVLRYRARDLSGVINGIDPEVWNPRKDPHIPAPFDAGDLAGKEICKRRLLEELGVGDGAERPVVGFVSRLVEQKGLDIVTEALPALRESGIRLVVHGEGDPRYHDRLQAAAREMPDTLSVVIPYDEPLSRRITAGSDMMLMPSRFEPCGLTHIYGMRYGSVPVVRETGGLRDSVRAFSPDTGDGTGFRFGAYSAQTLVGALRQALDLFRNTEAWRRVVANAMSADFSWSSSAVEYGDLYQSALDVRAA
jgi:starch synthase